MSETTFVYVLGSDGRTKIGLADDVARRIQGIRHAIGREVVLHGSRSFPARDAAFKAERALHRKFQETRLLGEWFTVAPEIALAALNELPAPDPTTAPPQPEQPVPPSRADIIYEAALAMAEGRASRSQIDDAMRLINA